MQSIAPSIPIAVFVTLFMLLPVALLAWMTIERFRQKRKQLRGFDVVPSDKNES